MIQAEKLIYQENKLSANLIVLYISLNMLYTIMTLEKMPVNLFIGSFTLINIILSLVGFLVSTKCKAYDINWAYAGLGLAAFQFLRFFFIPDGFEPSYKLLLIVVLLSSAVALLVGSLITIKRAKIKNTYTQSLQL